MKRSGLLPSALGVALLFLGTNCKPAGADSELANIVGVNAQGQDAALSLLPVRNFTIAKLDGSDPGVKQATALTKTKLFALVECVTVKNADGDTISAAQLMSALEMRAAIDDLYVDEYRNLLTSHKDNALAEYGSTERKLFKLPCQVQGRRLLSWEVLSDVQTRAAGLPKKMPSGTAGARVDSIYRLVQAMHLSIRGSYTKELEQDFMPRLPSIIEAIGEQAGISIPVKDVAGRIKAADRVYNPCEERPAGAALPYAASLKKRNYACVPSPRAGAFNYRAGAGGTGYEKVKALIAKEIDATHKTIFDPDLPHDPALYALWEVLTSTAPFGSGKGLRQEIGTFLKTGKGLDWHRTFASNASGAKLAGALPKRINSNNVAAPLALGVDKSRSKTIVRASKIDRKRGLLDGGTLSFAENRPATVDERIAILGKYTGPNGTAKLDFVRRQVQKSLSLLRSPPR